MPRRALLLLCLVLLQPAHALLRPAVVRARAYAPRLLASSSLFDTPLPETLDEDAQALLEESKGDVEVARSSYIGYTLAYLEESMPELYRMLKVDPNLPEAHAALLEVTWDAIAAFMPVTHTSRPSPEAAQRLTAISRVALPTGGAAETTRVLDVGCGHGVLYPFLNECGLSPTGYRGVDLSSRMIDLAKRAHGGSGATFEDLSFADECAREETYDTILFNGSLQFFEDQPATLAEAAALLSDSDEARIVISHVSGASFVRRELGDNPQTVRNTMPFLEMMQEVAGANSLQVVLPSFLGTEVEEIEKALERFYLIVLRKSAPGEDGYSAEQPLGELELPEELRVDTTLRLE